jgi:polyhydroxyalkanoate synthesis repressor PhaR
MAKSAADKVTIKKYANRRLYDTESSSYITLDKLAAMIRDGRDFEVLDAKSGEDITHQVLTQIIVDEESRGTTMLPANFLRQLIGMYGGQSEGLVSPFLDSAMEAFKKNQETVAGAFSNTMFADLAKRNMAMFGGAAQAFTPTPAPANEADGKAASEEIAKLKAELAALQAKVDKLR